MASPWRAFWDKVPPEDRKLIRRTVRLCAVILVLSLGALAYYLTRPEAPSEKPSDSSAHPADSAPLPPPLPEGDSDLLSPEAIALPLPSDDFSMLDSFDAQAHRELMRLSASRFEYARAVAHGERLAHKLGDDPDFAAEMGHLLLEAGEPARALEYLRKAPVSSPPVAIDLSLALFRSSKADSALRLAQSSLRAQPDDAGLLTLRASLLAEWPDTSRRAEARPLFLALLRKHPRYAEARYQFARYLMNLGDMAQAHMQLQDAVELDPLNPKVHARLGMALFYRRQDAAAERSYRTALGINPNDYNTWFNLGELYLSQANESSRAQDVKAKTMAAMEAYLHTLALRPQHGPAHFRTGTLLNGNREYREAILHLDAALSQEPSSVRILLQLATAWEQLGDTTRALAYLEAAHQSDPFNKVVATQTLRLRPNPLPPTP